jgi:ACS family hexuronate transporter-like MFS transporter
VALPVLDSRLPQSQARHRLRLIGPPLVVIYLVADVGSIGGGWLSSSLIKRGWSVNAGRKTAMFVCALAVLPMMFASGARDLWVAVGLISIAAAAHQGWSANLFTLVSDTFPRQAVGSVVGLGGMAGAIGGMLIAKLTGYLLQVTWQLRAGVPDGVVRVPDRARTHPPARSTPGTGTGVDSR